MPPSVDDSRVGLWPQVGCLASCLYRRTQVPDEVQLLAYDTRLNEAARVEGVPLLASV